MELLERVEVGEGPVLQLLDEVVVQLQLLQTWKVPESAASDRRDPVLGQDQGLQAEEVGKGLLFEPNDGVVVKPQPDQRRQVTEGSPLDDGQVVVAQVEVLQLRHVGEGAADLHDGVVGHVQGGQVSQGVEGVPR